MTTKSWLSSDGCTLYRMHVSIFVCGKDICTVIIKEDVQSATATRIATKINFTTSQLQPQVYNRNKIVMETLKAALRLVTGTAEESANERTAAESLPSQPDLTKGEYEENEQLETVLKLQHVEGSQLQTEMPAKRSGDMYRSVPEQTVPVEGQVRGVIPTWLNGKLIRNGPGLFEIGDTKLNHFFDGMALLHSFTIQSGKVTHMSKFLRSDSYKQNMAAKRLVVSEFGTAAVPDPCKTLFEKVSSYYYRLTDPTYGMSDNCMVSVYPAGDNLVAATETDFIHVFSPETLDSQEKVKLSEHVSVYRASAHPHIDKDGTAYNLGSTRTGYAIIKMPPSQKGASVMENASILSNIPATDMFRPGYSHSFAMTENYFVFLEQPLRVNILKVIKNSLLNHRLLINEILEWDENEMVRFFVVEKSTGMVLPQKFVAPPTLILHHINAYEDNGHIVMDGCAYKDWKLYEGTYLKDINDPSSDIYKLASAVEARRYVLPIDAAFQDPTKENLVTLDYTSATAKFEDDSSIMCHHEIISEKAFELPQVNYERYNAKPYQFIYGASFTGPVSSELIKTDLKTKKCLTWTEEGCSVSEPVFVGNPAATKEDDGVILSAVLRVDESQPPYLLVLDAKTMSELGRVDFPGIRWHKDVHGMFMRSHED